MFVYNLNNYFDSRPQYLFMFHFTLLQYYWSHGSEDHYQHWLLLQNTVHTCIKTVKRLQILFS
jgi:hypothetical protein